jgi:hypothetical protein
MANTDFILRSLTASLAATVVPSGNIYFDRAEQPSGLSGFPYIRVFCTDTREIRSQDFVINNNTGFSTYTLTIEIWTVQQGNNDQMTDQCNYQRALDGILNKIPPNTPWHYIPSFIHCIKDKECKNDIKKAPELYQGCDVYYSIQQWKILCSEE